MEPHMAGCLQVGFAVFPYELIMESSTETNGGRYEPHQVPITSPNDLRLSKMSCNGDVDPISRRCIFKDVMIFHGEIITRKQFYDKLKFKLSDLSDTIYGINTESALHFAPITGDNPYHVLFEEMIPIYEILKSDPILSKWINPSNNNTIKVLNYGESALKRNNPFTVTFFKHFFPHIDFSFRDLDWYNLDENGELKNNKIYMVNHLIAGSNHSCVHYYYCSRSDFSTPYIASEFRDYMLSKVGISSSSYREKYKLIKHPNNTIQFKFIPNKTLIKSNKSKSRNNLQRSRHRNYQPNVVIIQRWGKRYVSNLDDIVTVVAGITGETPSVVYYEELNLNEQIKLTFSTDILIMIHGGGLANSFYLPPYATLIDIYPFPFPYHMYGLVNWMRYALRDIPIAHAPFDIIEPTHMTYHTNHSLPLCLPPVGYNYWTAFRFFWSVDSVVIDPIRFKSFFKIEYKKWHSKTNYITPMTRETFLNYSKSFKEPWYAHTVRKRANNINSELPDCVKELDELDKLYG
eukprot:gene5649-11399_t